ncbi:MAG: hypothetical protein P1P88_26440, partial [Bacteroidales bacterium]|nr:hypothetical protein [Bacteroidales bacterium]
KTNNLSNKIIPKWNNFTNFLKKPPFPLALQLVYASLQPVLPALLLVLLALRPLLLALQLILASCLGSGPPCTPGISPC